MPDSHHSSQKKPPLKHANSRALLERGANRRAGGEQGTRNEVQDPQYNAPAWTTLASLAIAVLGVMLLLICRAHGLSWWICAPAGVTLAAVALLGEYYASCRVQPRQARTRKSATKSVTKTARRRAPRPAQSE